MRQNNNNNSNNNSNNRNRARGRGRKSSNPMNRNFESNGPDVKIRGNAGHIAEKYTNLARDALTSGDPVMAENYYQHAEHYNRIVALAQQNAPTPQPVKSSDDQRDDQRNGSGPQPDVEEASETAADGDAEIAVKGEGEQPSEKKPRPRRNTRSRQPKQDEVEGDSEDAVATSEPSDEAESEVAEAKPRSRNRRPRARKEENISDDASKLPGGLTAAPAATEEEPAAAED